LSSLPNYLNRQAFALTDAITTTGSGKIQFQLNPVPLEIIVHNSERFQPTNRRSHIVNRTLIILQEKEAAPIPLPADPHNTRFAMPIQETRKTLSFN
jgi:hypothetical protein